MDEKFFVIGDLHFGDEVVRKLNRKNYETLEIMNKEIIRIWNKNVGVNDTVYVLGDVGTKNCVSNVLKLNGKKILILGNHDIDMHTDKKGNYNLEQIVSFYKENGFSEVYNVPIFINDNIIISHEPQPVDTSFYINIHAHLHNAKLNINNYYNVSWDVVGFGPVNLKIYEKYAMQCKKIRKKFSKEWYSNNYSFLRDANGN